MSARRMSRGRNPDLLCAHLVALRSRGPMQPVAACRCVKLVAVKLRLRQLMQDAAWFSSVGVSLRVLAKRPSSIKRYRGASIQGLGGEGGRQASLTCLAAHTPQNPGRFCRVVFLFHWMRPSAQECVDRLEKVPTEKPSRLWRPYTTAFAKEHRCEALSKIP